MITRATLVMLALLVFCGVAAAAPAAERIATLRHGLNITGWFRYPTSRDPAALRSWLSDAAIRDLRGAGFTFVRLAIDPALVAEAPLRAVLIDSIGRLQRLGLGVVVSPHPDGWHLETVPEDRSRLRAFWRVMASDLRSLNPALTYPETLNEPVFPGDATGWQMLQRALLAEIRSALPTSTVLVTGPNWGSIGGLLTQPEETDPNVVYSFHFYDPVELTSLAAYRAELDRFALARLPFPVTDTAGCRSIAESARDPRTIETMRYYCALGWDRSRIAASVARAADWARAHHTVLLAGEFGATARLNRAARLAWLRSVRETFEAADIGWALWGYDDVMGLAVARPPGTRPVLDRDVLAALGLRIP